MKAAQREPTNSAFQCESTRGSFCNVVSLIRLFVASGDVDSVGTLDRGFQVRKSIHKAIHPRRLKQDKEVAFAGHEAIAAFRNIFQGLNR